MIGKIKREKIQEAVTKKKQKRIIVKVDDGAVSAFWLRTKALSCRVCPQIG